MATRCALFTTALMAAIPTLAVSQDTPEVGIIEQIIVTAQKRAEDMQSVPISMAAFSGEMLGERGVSELQDIASFVPNVVFDAGARTSGATSASSIFIRGVGQTDFFASAEPGVGIYIDGVYFGRTQGSVLDVLDIERVEVLRGPQGTLFGRNTIGGAISVVSQRPSGEFGGYAEAAVGEFNQRDARLSVEGPVVDDVLAARVSVSSRQRDGYAKSLITGQQFGDVDSLSGRGTLLFTPHDSLSFALTGDFTRQRESGRFQLISAVRRGFIVNLYNALVASPSPYGPINPSWITDGTYTNNSTGPDSSNLDTRGVAGTLDWSLAPNLSLISITAYRELESDSQSDSDGMPFPFTATDLLVDQSQFSQELRLAGEAFGERLKWMMGGYYFNEDITEDQVQRLFSGLYAAAEAAPCCIFGFGGAGNPANAGLDADVRQHFDHDNRSWAIFGQATFSLTERIDATLGLRYNEEKKTVAADTGLLGTGAVILPPGTVANMHWTSLTPRFSLEYQASDDFLLYASVAEGFKAGGVNPRPQTLDEFTVYEPETVLSYEAGFKSDWMNGRLRINGALFQADYEDLQFLYRIPAGASPACPSTQTAGCHVAANATSVSLWGGELEVSAMPAEQLEVFIGLGYIRNEFDKIDPQLEASGQISTDTVLPKTPEWTFQAGAQYTLALGDSHNVSLRADYSHRDKSYQDFENSQRIAQGALGLLSARVTFGPDDRRWEIALSGQNLTDEYYRTSGVDSYNSLGVSTVGIGTPRTWTLQARVRF